MEARSVVLYEKEEGTLDMRPLTFEVHMNTEPDAQRTLEISVESHALCLGGKWGKAHCI